MFHSFRRTAFGLVLCASTSMLPFIAHAEVKPFSPSFRAQQMPVTGATQHVRIGGQGPAVLLLHGFGDTGDMWQPLAEVLVKWPASPK